MYGDQLWVDTLLPLSWHLLLVTFLENILAIGGSHPFLVPLVQQLAQGGGIGQAAVRRGLAATYQLHYWVSCGPEFEELAILMLHQERWWNCNGLVVTKLDGH